eukprot:3122717-Prymnesium_polylepis.1
MERVVSRYRLFSIVLASFFALQPNVTALLYFEVVISYKLRPTGARRSTPPPPRRGAQWQVAVYP